MKRVLMAAIILVVNHAAWTSESNVAQWQTDADLQTVYPVLYETLEAKRFYVVFEPDIQNNLSRFAERWGEDYNRNQLEGIRAMVFCNGWYANSVGNADPDMLALCPLHLTLVQRQGATRILFVRPSVVAAGTAAEAVAREIEQAVGEAVRAAIEKLPASPADGG
jgi:uncharacterized protein (DUF302 family)